MRRAVDDNGNTGRARRRRAGGVGVIVGEAAVVVVVVDARQWASQRTRTRHQQADGGYGGRPSVCIGSPGALTHERECV